jgi:hypothetical protein
MKLMNLKKCLFIQVIILINLSDILTESDEKQLESESGSQNL